MRRNIRHRDELDLFIDTGVAKRFAENRVLNLVHMVHDFRLRIRQPDRRVKPLIEHDVNVFIDRGGHQETAVLFIVRGQISPATSHGQTDRRP